MDRFLLAENPMRPEQSGVWINHMLDPVAIIRCSEGKTNVDKVNQYFVYINTDNVPEEWTLSIYFIARDIEEKEMHHLLDRAWRWYRAYMEYEDKNIDIDDEAKDN
jgi:hypothetical protein